MGFVRANTIPTLHEHKRRPWSGSALCLGQADVYFDFARLAAMAKQTDTVLAAGSATGLSHRADLAAKGYLSREALFTSLGFSTVEALDISRFEGAEIEFDLNSAALPEALAGRFDAVFDHGTMEHVFHVPNCLANIHGMLKPGGRVVHTNPASNQIDHGFYMFSPTFFHDFYSANDWEIRTLQLVRFDPQRQETEEPTFLAWNPSPAMPLSTGSLEPGTYVTVCIAEKTAASTGHVVPQQGYYRKAPDWQPEPEPEDLDDLPLPPPFRRDVGNCWVCELPAAVEEGDSVDSPRRSTLQLYEDEKRLGPGHDIHDAIRTRGKGTYSHWGRALYFSSSDNTDPNANARSYRARVRRRT